MTIQELNEKMVGEQENDEATAWTKAAHWSRQLSADQTMHLIVVGRTIVRDYSAVFTGGKLQAVQTPAEVSEVGLTFNTALMKAVGWKRHKAHLMYNEITKEIAIP